MAFTFAGRYCEVALKSDGTLAKGVTVQVNISGGAAATLYTDHTKGTGASNPVVTDSTTGVIAFWADPGYYDLVGTGISVIGVQVPADPAEYLQTIARNAPSGVAGLDAARHLVAQALPITAVAGSAAGGSPPVPIFTGCTDQRGVITFGTGTAPSAGAMVVITFGAAWGATPILSIDAGNGPTALLSPYSTGTSTTGVTIALAVAPAASQANTIYSVSFATIG